VNITPAAAVYQISRRCHEWHHHIAAVLVRVNTGVNTASSLSALTASN